MRPLTRLAVRGARWSARTRVLAAAFVAALGAALGLGACAQASPPPGGPPDPLPPALVSLTPDSGAVSVDANAVVFRFDEVVNERPRGTASLAGLVLISPYHGEPVVGWRRTAVTARPPGGWRDNTVYTVRLLPGLADLRGNELEDELVTVFSTGPVIPETEITGVVFDWVEQRVVTQAWVEAMTLPDSVAYVARADSAGRFVIPFVPAGAILVRGIADRNRNFGLDPGEAWDTVHVALRDSAAVELYLFQHDSAAVGIANVNVVDSTTLRVPLTRPMSPTRAVDESLVELLDEGLVPVPIASVQSQRVVDSLSAAAARARADSLAAAADTVAADTLAAPPPAPPVPPAVPDTAADTTRPLPPPVPTRPPPVTQLVVRTAQPLVPGTSYTLRLRDAVNLIGVTDTASRTFQVPERAAPDTTAADTAGAAPPDTGSTPLAVGPTAAGGGWQARPAVLGRVAAVARSRAARAVALPPRRQVAGRPR